GERCRRRAVHGQGYEPGGRLGRDADAGHVHDRSGGLAAAGRQQRRRAAAADPSHELPAASRRIRRPQPNVRALDRRRLDGAAVHHGYRHDRRRAAADGGWSPMMPNGSAWAGLSCAFLALMMVDANAQDAREWLARMNRAVEELNYEGTFVHVRGNYSETLHIIHRNHNGRISERLVSRDGPGREFIREEDVVKVILPEQRLVVIESRQEEGRLASALPNYCAELEPHYEFTLGRGTRVANRPVNVVSIKPKDEFRYGYTLYLDRETAMPLKSLLLNERGEIIEQIVFTQIQISDFIPASALHPAIDTECFQHPEAEAPQTDAVPISTPEWRASMLPPGFR